MMISILVPRHLVKTIKICLENQGKLDRSRKIERATENGGSAEGTKYLIPTTIAEEVLGDNIRVPDDDVSNCHILTTSKIDDFINEIEVVTRAEQVRQSPVTGYQRKDPLHRVIAEWMTTLPDEVLNLILSHLGLKTPCNLKFIPNVNYMIYEPLLLLSPEFSPFLSLGEGNQVQHLDSLFHVMCKKMRTTHIALRSPVLPHLPSHHLTINASADSHLPTLNTLRSPTNFTPLYGSFGPLLPPTHLPTPIDFASAFWCSTRQNGITQVWAPRYTMFSRGNISEKTRVLKLDTLKAERLGCPPAETTAVDLYAGIGYFAFSYAKAGVGKVLCWDINAWSLEGLRIGASRNRWKTAYFGKNENEEIEAAKLVVFEESNECAASRVQRVRSNIPPVRHVSCGYLPSSQASWRSAVQVLDPNLGGWVHAHENVAKGDIQSRAMEIVAAFKELTKELCGTTERAEVQCEHIEQVKSYAPGIYHCVYDIAITPVNATL